MHPDRFSSSLMHLDDGGIDPTSHSVCRSECSVLEDSISGSSSRRQAPVESESWPEVHDLVPDAKGRVLSEECKCVQESRSWHGKLREFKASRLAKMRAASRAEVRTGGFWTTTPPFAHAGRSFDVSRWKAGRVAPGAKSSATDTSHHAWDVPQICKGARAPSGRRRRNRRSPGRVLERLLFPARSASPWFAPSCCRDGSLAVIQPIWAQESSEAPPMSEGVAVTQGCAHTTSSGNIGLRWDGSTARFSKSSPHGSVHPHLAGDVHVSGRVPGVEKKKNCPTPCAASPSLVGRNRNFRNWNVHQDRDRLVGPHGQALASMGQQALARTQGRGTTLEFQSPCRSTKCSRRQPTLSCTKRVTVEPASIGCAVSELCKKCRDEVSGWRSPVSEDTTKAVVLRPITSVSRSHSHKVETCATCRSIVNRAFETCSLDLVSWRKRLRGSLLDTTFGPRYDVTMLLVLTGTRQDVAAGKCVAGISPPRQHTSRSHKIMSASAAIADSLYRARITWILGRPCDSCLGNVPKIEALAAQPRTAWALADYCIVGSKCRKRALFTVGNVNGRDLHRIAFRCAGTGGRCSVSRQEQGDPAKSSALHVTTPALPVYLSRLPWFSA